MSKNFQEYKYPADTPGDQVWAMLKQHLSHPDERVELRRDPDDSQIIIERYWIADTPSKG